MKCLRNVRKNLKIFVKKISAETYFAEAKTSGYFEEIKNLWENLKTFRKVRQKFKELKNNFRYLGEFEMGGEEV